MSPLFVAFRRRLPGGAIVLISLEQDAAGGGVRGIMQLERRHDPARQASELAPVLAEVHGTTQADVLGRLRALAEHDAEVARRLEEWQARRRMPPRDDAGA